MARPSPGPDTTAVAAGRAGHCLEIQCRRCRHRGLVPGGILGEAGERPLSRIAEVLKCRKCGTKGAVQVWIAERR
jgi:hypothetical protein